MSRNRFSNKSISYWKCEACKMKSFGDTVDSHGGGYQPSHSLGGVVGSAFLLSVRMRYVDLTYYF